MESTFINPRCISSMVFALPGRRALLRGLHDLDDFLKSGVTTPIVVPPNSHSWSVKDRPKTDCQKRRNGSKARQSARVMQIVNVYPRGRKDGFLAVVLFLGTNIRKMQQRESWEIPLNHTSCVISSKNWNPPRCRNVVEL